MKFNVKPKKTNEVAKNLPGQMKKPLPMPVPKKPGLTLKTINWRSVLYGLVGLVAGISLYVLFLVQIPESAIAKSKIEEFNGGVSQEVPWDYADPMNPEYPDGMVPEEDPETPGEIVQKLGYETQNGIIGDSGYIVRPENVLEYITNLIFSYGRLNPMRYFQDKNTSVETPVTDGTSGTDGTDGISTPVESGTNDGSNPGTIISDSIAPPKTGDYEDPVVTVTDGTSVTTPEQAVTLAFVSGSLPVKKNFYSVVSKFGPRKSPVDGSDEFHYGIDIQYTGITGAEVYSILPGIVSNINTNEEYGNYIVIDHGTSSTLYAHLLENKIAIKIGDRVFSGDVIGYVGKTGAATEAHLHLEMDVDGKRVDPELFLNSIVIK